MKRAHGSLFAVLLAAAVCCAVLAPAAQAAQQGTQATPVNAHELARFNHINALARRIQRRYRQAFAHAQSGREARHVAHEMDRAVTRMFRSQGMSVARYRHIRRYLMREALNGSRPMVVAGTTPPKDGGS